jgi:KDO2-lipid IV(A) lauroyltransferase
MAKQRSIALDYLAYVGLRLFAMFVHMFGWEANYRTARWICGAIWRAGKRWPKLGRFERRAVAHLRLSFPDWPEERIHRVAKASLRNFLYLGLEVLFTTRLITPARWRRHVALENQAENVRLMLERKTPLIYVSGHFGNWEVVGYTMGALGFRMTAVARPLDNPFINRYIYGIRAERGMTILDKKGAAEQAESVLAGKGLLSFVADQDAGRKGCFVDFFGRKASTYKSIALLAMSHGAPIVVGYGRRLDEEYHFAIGIQRVIYPHEWADKADPMRWITQEYTKALEDVIRTAPEQYLWTHRRWKHRPKGEGEAIDGIA